MKLLPLLLCILIAGSLHAQTNFYDLSVVSSSGEVINMSSYKGKKLLIVVASPGMLIAKSPSRYLDQVQSSNPEIRVLILPYKQAEDSSSAVEVKQYSGYNNTRIRMVIDEKKIKTGEQAPLLQWLMRASENKHFEKAILNDEQFYVISESGVLYAVLEKGVSDSLLKVVLTGSLSSIQSTPGADYSGAQLKRVYTHF